MHPALWIKWVATLTTACVLAWLVYFIVLFALDYLLGIRQLGHELLLNSPGGVVRRIFAIIRDSAWLVVPLVSFYALVLFIVSRSPGRLHTLLAIAAGASLLLAGLMWLRIPPLQTVPFVVAFITAMLFIHMIIGIRER